MKLSPGDVILHDKHRVERFLGTGALARVYLVRHLERDVKVVSRHTPGARSIQIGGFQQRFELEAQLRAMDLIAGCPRRSQESPLWREVLPEPGGGQNARQR